MEGLSCSSRSVRSTKSEIDKAAKIDHNNPNRLLSEGTKIANSIIVQKRFVELIHELTDMDESTVFEQATKVKVSFQDPAYQDKDTRVSWAWVENKHGLENVDIFINSFIEKQVIKFNIAPETFEWKQYVLMIGLLIFHEFAHLCLHWKNYDSSDLSVHEMGEHAESIVFGSNFKYVFNKRPEQETSQGIPIIDENVQLIGETFSNLFANNLNCCFVGFVMLNDQGSAAKRSYVENFYELSVKEQPVPGFKIHPVVREPKMFNPGHWKSRLIDEPTDQRPEASQNAEDSPITFGWCPIAIRRSLAYGYSTPDYIIHGDRED